MVEITDYGQIKPARSCLGGTPGDLGLWLVYNSQMAWLHLSRIMLLSLVLLNITMFVPKAAAGMGDKPSPSCEGLDSGPKATKEGFLPVIGKKDQDPKDLGMMHYKMYGTAEAGKPLLLMIHGGGADMSTFYNVLPNLTQKYSVLLVDQPGHGQSQENTAKLSKDPAGKIDDSWMTDYTPATMAESVRRLIDQLGIKHVNLIGHSLGARTAACLMQQIPDRVDSLVIEDMELINRTKNEKPEKGKIEALKSHFEQSFDSEQALLAALRPFYPKEKYFNHKENKEMEFDPAKNILDAYACQDKDGRWKLRIRLWVAATYQYEANLVDLNTTLAANKKIPLLVMQSPKNQSLTEPGLTAMRKVRDLEFWSAEGSEHAIHQGKTEQEFLTHLNHFLGPADALTPANVDPAHSKTDKANHQ